MTALAMSVSQLQAQLTVVPLSTTGNNGAGVNLTQWVQTHLIGAGVTISNVTYTGANR